MSQQLNYTNDSYLILFIIYGERDKVNSKICQMCQIYYISPKQKHSPKNVERITERFKKFGSAKRNVQRNKSVVENEIAIENRQKY